MKPYFYDPNTGEKNGKILYKLRKRVLDSHFEGSKHLYHTTIPETFFSYQTDLAAYQDYRAEMIRKTKKSAPKLEIKNNTE